MAAAKEPSGADRAAAFLLSLEAEQAAEVIKHLDEHVMVGVVEAMGSLDRKLVDPSNIQRLQKELLRGLSQPSSARVRSESELFEMLEKTLGQAQAQAVFEKIQEHLLQERPFLSIERESAAHIASALQEESTAVATLVVAHIDPALSAEILALLPAERSLEIVKRMAQLVPPGFDTLIAIAEDLKGRIAAAAQVPSAGDPSLRLKTIAEVLNFSQPELEKSVLEGIDAENADMAAEIREFMFTWEDLSTVDKRGMQKILASIETRTLAVALKGSSKPVEDNIMANLSARVREMVKDERELAGPMSLKEVQGCRDEMLASVRRLMESGEWRPARAGDELVS
jgi:flagellar motor switch protein FliG